MSTLQMSEQYLQASSKSKGWFFVLGLLLVILGAVAISVATFTTLLSVVFLGATAFIGGILVLIDSFKFWRHRERGFWTHLLLGIFYLILGGIFIANPVQGAMSLTLLLAIVYIIIGLFRIFYSMSLRALGWGFALFSGIIAVALGALILMHWPSSSLVILGLFVGIDLIFAGIAYMMMSFASKPLLA